MSIDLNQGTANVLLAPGEITATGNGATYMYCHEYVGKGKIILNAQGGSGTSPTLDLKIQHQINSDLWNDIPGAAFEQVGEADSLQDLDIDFNSCQGKIRVAYTLGGTTPSFHASVVVYGQQKSV